MAILHLRAHTTIMKIIALLSCLILIKSEASPNDFVMDGVRHYREILFKNMTLGYYSALAVDYTTNDLYISNKMIVLNLKTKEHKFISGIGNSQSVTIDQDTRKVYISTSNGIYSYNSTNNETQLVGARNIDVMCVHYRKILYYSRYNSGEMNTLVSGQVVKFDDLKFTIHDFVVDNEENIVCISTDQKLYTLTKDKKHLIFYRGVTVNQLTTDRYGKVYFSAQDGVYRVKMSVSSNIATLEKVLSIDNPRDIAFDNEGNLIYFSAKDTKIYTLKPIADVHYNFSNHYDSLSSKIDNLAQIILTLQAKVDKLQTDIKGEAAE